MGFVYMIGPVEPVKPYRVKIGKADSPQARLRELQCGSPFRLGVLAVHECANPREVESYFHKLLAAHRQHGEWFDLGINPVPRIQRIDPKKDWVCRDEVPRLQLGRAQTAIMNVLLAADGPVHYNDLAQCAGLAPTTTSVILVKLKRRGEVTNPKRGYWAAKR